METVHRFLSDSINYVTIRLDSRPNLQRFFKLVHQLQCRDLFLGAIGLASRRNRISFFFFSLCFALRACRFRVGREDPVF